ncbi:MAG TPA: TonB-dependent receptor [Nitrospirota bacterium]|nr:TonB-dependent receptor [Nitrospirota bacterium]
MREEIFFIRQVEQKKLMRTLLNSTAALIMTAITLLVSSGDALACASCGCTLSSDWENLQFSYQPGVKLDLRYDYLDQDQLRSGSRPISPAAASQIVNNGNPQEVEKYTINNYLTMGVDYSSSRDWGVNVQVPYIDRKHSTLGTASDGSTAGPGGGQYDSHTSSFGDIRVIGRYQGFTPQCKFGILYGIKLPTGSFTNMGTSTDPTAPGPVPIDRGLQPGTGTTDAILGAYYADGLNQNWDYFTQALFQKALNSRDNYKPGDGFNFNVGLRYAGITAFSPQLQLNYRYVQHDVGSNADQISTGGTLLYISPGISASLSQQVSVYAFYQLPLYQDVNGVQLAPKYTASLGVRYSF